MESDAAKAERLSSRRTRALPVLAVIFVSQQATFLAGAGAGERTVDHVQVGAWLILSVVMILALATGGGWVYSRAVRTLANDESTRAYRADALRVGFFTAMTACIILYAVDLIEPVSGRQALHLVMSAGIASALLRFAYLERRANKLG